MMLEATYKITTPMFIAGAEQEKTPELRPPSFKGLLRFWFRAIALPRLGDWRKVQKLENEIFGSTDRQSSFYLDLDILDIAEEKNKSIGDFKEKYGLIYLGHGLVNYKGELQRLHYTSSSIFNLRLLFKEKEGEITEKAKLFLPLTLKALGFFGGAGARSRRGFGSLSLLSLSLDGQKIWEPPNNVDELIEDQRELINELGIKTEEESGLPDYTAFSSKTKIWIGKTGSQAIDVLNEIGLELLRYRSYGKNKNGKHILSNGEAAEPNFKSDHDLLMQFCQTGELENFPDRMVFGLPHNYYFSSTRTKYNVQIHPIGKANRRASPLFIHIHELANDSYAAVLSLFPVRFLPQNTTISISVKERRTPNERYENKFNKRINYNKESAEYQIIENFMERSAFSHKVVVWP